METDRDKKTVSEGKTVYCVGIKRMLLTYFYSVQKL